jgi:hypothetical protein
MADTPTKIDDLPFASARNTTDVLEVSQAGVSAKMQVAMLVPPTDLSAYAPKASPTFTGNPQAPTPAPGDNDQSIATTAFVQAAIAAALAPVGGDFWARSNTTFSSPTSATVVAPNAVITGNSGSWYNPANGRYTPPAGRFLIRASIWLASASTAVGVNVQLRKNGTTILAAAGQVPGSGSWYGDPEVEVLVDANGTDYFEMLGFCGSAQNIIADFLAAPTRR